MREENSIFLSRLTELIGRVEDRAYEISTDFLDMSQRSLAENILQRNKNVSYEFFGGYEEAERTVGFIRPSYLEKASFDDLSLLKVSKSTKGGELSHRDYLGAILSLGVRREKIGDIIVNPKGADIFVKKELVPFFVSNFNKVGRENIEVREASLLEVEVVVSKGEIVKDTVASLRSDNIISSIFSINRKEASKFIKSGSVFVNNIEMKKVDKEIEEGDKLVLRGMGRGYLRKIGGKSRKDRIFIEAEVFKK